MEVTDDNSKNDDNEISPGSQELNKKFWDIVCLMASNRQHLEAHRLFPGKRFLFNRCGNVRAARRITSEPRFQVGETLLIHVGVNDTESENCNAVDIANPLKEVALLVKEQFPNATVYVSEMTPRMDSLNEILSEVNQILGRAKILQRLTLIIKHDNLNRRSYFVDKKHFNKAAAIPQLAKNIKYSINNTGAYKRNTSFQRKKKYGDTRPRARGPFDNNYSKPADMNFSGKRNVSQSAENPGHNSSSEVSTFLKEVMKQFH